MSGLVTTGEKNLVLVSGRAHMDLAHAVGEEIGCGVSPVTAYDFASGEIYVRFNESVRGADVFVLQSIAGDINKWLMEQLIMIDALKRASARSITVVSPFYPYARQDKKHKGREPISARLVSDLYKTAGADRLMCVDLHTSQIQGFFDGPLDHLFAIPVLAKHIRERVENLSNVTVVSPDTGRVRVAEHWADLLDGVPGRTDEDELGLTYPQIDDYLEGKEIDEAAAAKLEQIYLRSRHKRTTPVTIFDSWWKN